MIKSLLALITISILSLPVQATDFSKLVAGHGGDISSTNKPTLYTYVKSGDTISLQHFSVTIPFCAIFFFDDLSNALKYGSKNLTVDIERDGLLTVSCVKNSKSLFGHKFLFGIFKNL